MKMYADYIKERTGRESTFSDNGFATYMFFDPKPADGPSPAVEGGCYIEDIYVDPAFRQSGQATQMADAIVAIAQAKGYKTLYGTVAPAAKGSTASLKVLLAYGFKLWKSDQNLIWFVKDIGV
jgi:ribosomal protein S18 acetylase RimI-like enzyme